MGTEESKAMEGNTENDSAMASIWPWDVSEVICSVLSVTGHAKEKAKSGFKYTM